MPRVRRKGTPATLHSSLLMLGRGLAPGMPPPKHSWPNSRRSADPRSRRSTMDCGVPARRPKTYVRRAWTPNWLVSLLCSSSSVLVRTTRPRPTGKRPCSTVAASTVACDPTS